MRWKEISGNKISYTQFNHCIEIPISSVNLMQLHSSSIGTKFTMAEVFAADFAE